jgi:hypothetical protein
MFSSASTWTFNLVREIASSLAPDRPGVPVFLDVADALPGHDDGCLIVKTHGTVIACELGRRAEAIVVTIRDPRDTIVSLMRHNGLPFEIVPRMTEVSAWTCMPFMAHRRSVLFSMRCVGARSMRSLPIWAPYGLSIGRYGIVE